MTEEQLLVKQLMSKDVVAVGPDSTVSEALSRMEQHDIHELPVMTNSTLKGWISYDELIQRPHLPPQSKVAALATMPPRLAQTADVVFAADTMIRNNVRALPVVDTKGHIVGILSRTDLMKAALQIKEIAGLPLVRVMNRDLETLPETATVDEAARILRGRSIRQVLVLNSKGKLAGVVGQESLVHAFASEDARATAPRGAGGTVHGPGREKDRKVELKGLLEDPITLAPEANLGEAIQGMLRQHRTYIVVMEDGFPVGVVSRANVVERLAARAARQATLVQIIGLSGFADGMTLDQLHARAQNTLKKIEKQFRVEFLSLHFKIYKAKTDGDSKYSVTAHLSTEQKFIVAKADDWDALKAANTALGELERRAIETKDMRLERRKRGRRGAADPYTAAP